MSEDNNKPAVTPEAIGVVLSSILANDNQTLLALNQEQLAAEWFWRWDDRGGIEWNIYKFSDMLEMYKRRCRRWEEHHNGNMCVVERVRDRYLMPRLREFRVLLAEKMAAADAATSSDNKTVGQPAETAMSQSTTTKMSRRVIVSIAQRVPKSLRAPPFLAPLMFAIGSGHFAQEMTRPVATGDLHAALLGVSASLCLYAVFLAFVAMTSSVHRQPDHQKNASTN